MFPTWKPFLPGRQTAATPPPRGASGDVRCPGGGAQGSLRPSRDWAPGETLRLERETTRLNKKHQKNLNEDKEKGLFKSDSYFELIVHLKAFRSRVSIYDHPRQSQSNHPGSQARSAFITNISSMPLNKELSSLLRISFEMINCEEHVGKGSK